MTMRIAAPLAVCAALLLPGAAGAAAYYVSPQGNDANDGLSPSTPWRTLTKVSSRTYGPGDRIHLRRGGRWTGETLVLRGGSVPGVAIVVEPYGPSLGPAPGRPHISPGIVNSSALVVEGGGGWLISGLELSNARWGVELRYDNVIEADTVDLSDLHIHDMTNAYNPVDYEKYNFVSAGIAIRHWTDAATSPTFLRNLFVRNVTMSNTNFAVWTGSICEGKLPKGGGERCTADGFSRNGLWAYVDGFSFDQLHVWNAPQYGLSLLFVRNGSVTNSSVQNVGYQGWQHGTAGSLIARATNVVFDHFDIFNVSRGYPPYDGCGFDFEGGTTNVTYRNSRIDTSDGAGFCVLDNGGNAGPNHGMLLENVSVTRFGRNPGNHDQGVLFGLVTNNHHTGVARNVRFHDAYGRPFIGTLGVPQDYSTTNPGASFYFDNCRFSRKLPILGGAAASTFEPGFEPGKAIDGNPATYWRMASGAALPQYWWIDLGQLRTLQRVELLFPEFTTWKFQLLGSNDGLNTLQVISDQSAGLFTNTFTFEGSVQYHWVAVRFEPGGPAAGLSEMNVFGQ
jgi:hypothetical protein